MDNTISEATRRNIIDYLIAGPIGWAGRLQEDNFLARIFDLTRMRSTDYRFKNAAGDIYQHRVRNYDWDEDWVFHDARINLLHGDDQVFLRFLCESIHPVVRPDTEKARKLAEEYNKMLEADGWVLKAGKEMSGKPVFEPRRTGERTEIFEEPTGWQKVDRQVQEVRMRLDAADSEEEYQAVGLLCREVLISTAQEVYDSTRHLPADGVAPSATDAKRMLEGVFEAELRGGGDEEARAHAKAAIRLALALQHRRTADFKMAALCAEATSSVVNLLAVLAGRRGRSL